jgi:hypothetical protein
MSTNMGLASHLGRDVGEGVVANWRLVSYMVITILLPLTPKP